MQGACTLGALFAILTLAQWSTLLDGEMRALVFVSLAIGSVSLILVNRSFRPSLGGE